MNHLLTLEELTEINPAFSSFKIRIDKDSKKASIIDIIQMVTGKNADYSSQIWRNMRSTLSEEIIQNVSNIKFKVPGSKQKPTPSIGASGLIEIIWLLPGKSAKKFRRQSAHYICRILGGDPELIGEMESRYLATDSDKAQFFLAKSERPAFDEQTETKIKRRRLDIELEKMELEQEKWKNRQNVENKQWIQKQELDHDLWVQIKNCEILKTTTDFKQTNIDFYNKNRELLSLDPHIVNACTQALHSSIVSGNTCEEFAPDFTTLYRQLDFPIPAMNVLAQLGKIIAQNYTKKNNKAPEKVSKLVNGSMRLVNIYPAKSTEWLLEQIKSFNVGAI
jgi:hypothetical protein